MRAVDNAGNRSVASPLQALVWDTTPPATPAGPAAATRRRRSPIADLDAVRRHRRRRHRPLRDRPRRQHRRHVGRPRPTPTATGRCRRASTRTRPRPWTAPATRPPSPTRSSSSSTATPPDTPLNAAAASPTPRPVITWDVADRHRARADRRRPLRRLSAAPRRSARPPGTELPGRRRQPRRLVRLHRARRRPGRQRVGRDAAGDGDVRQDAAAAGDQPHGRVADAGRAGRLVDAGRRRQPVRVRPLRRVPRRQPGRRRPRRRRSSTRRCRPRARTSTPSARSTWPATRPRSRTASRSSTTRRRRRRRPALDDRRRRRGCPHLTWDAGRTTTRARRGLDHYNVYRDGLLVGHSATTSFDDATVGQNGSYGYSLTAVDRAGNESLSSRTVIIRYDGTPPLPPLDPNGASPTRLPTFTWVAASDQATGGSAIASYRIYRNGAFVGETGGTSFTDAQRRRVRPRDLHRARHRRRRKHLGPVPRPRSHRRPRGADPGRGVVPGAAARRHPGRVPGVAAGRPVAGARRATWDFGDGLATGNKVAHVFSAAGTLRDHGARLGHARQHHGDREPDDPDRDAAGRHHRRPCSGCRR